MTVQSSEDSSRGSPQANDVVLMILQEILVWLEARMERWTVMLIDELEISPLQPQKDEKGTCRSNASPRVKSAATEHKVLIGHSLVATS